MVSSRPLYNRLLVQCHLYSIRPHVLPQNATAILFFLLILFLIPWPIQTPDFPSPKSHAHFPLLICYRNHHTLNMFLFLLPVKLFFIHTGGLYLLCSARGSDEQQGKTNEDMFRVSWRRVRTLWCADRTTLHDAKAQYQMGHTSWRNTMIMLMSTDAIWSTHVLGPLWFVLHTGYECVSTTCVGSGSGMNRYPVQGLLPSAHK
jgi:hypothetical protein